MNNRPEAVQAALKALGDAQNALDNGTSVTWTNATELPYAKLILGYIAQLESQQEWLPISECLDGFEDI